MSMAATYGGSHAPRFGPENAKLGSTYRNCHKPAVPIIRSVGCHGHKPTNPLSTKKRKQLEDIKAREELKAARNRLRSILLQKLVNRFKKARQRDISRLIDEMLTHKVKVTASELQQLEEACRILDKAAHEMAKSSAMKAKNSVTFGSTSTEGSDGAELTGTLGDCTPVSRVIKGHEWRLLMAYDMEQGELRDQQQLAEKRRKEAEAKKILDEQVAEKKRLAQLEKQQEKAYLDNLLIDLDRAEAEKNEHARLRKEKNDEKNELWQQQLRDERARKQAQREAELKREKELHEAALREAEKANDLLRRRKEEESARNQLLMEENEKDRLYKLELKQKEIEADNMMNKKYQEKLDREQKARDEAFKKRMEKLAKYAEQTDNGPIMKAKREEEARLEKIRQRDRKAKEDALREREERDKRNRYEGRLKMQNENQKQIDEKKRRAEMVKQADGVLAAKFLEDSQEAARQAQERRRLEAEARKIYGSRLMAQMEKDHVTKKGIDDMIERERRYNSKNLKNIVDDSKVYNKICGKLKLSLSEKLKTTIQLSKSSRL